MDRSRIDESLREGDENVTGYRKPLKLWCPMERLNPEKRSRGLVFGAPTRALYGFVASRATLGEFKEG